MTTVGIMLLLSGLGVNGYKKIATELNYEMINSQVRQLVTSTVAEAKRNKVPMQIQMHMGNIDYSKIFTVTGDFSLNGGQSSLVAYWNFRNNEIDPNSNLDQNGAYGINKLHLSTNPHLDEGHLGIGAKFSGDEITSDSSYLLNSQSNVYFECMVRVRVEEQLNNMKPNGAILLQGKGLTMALKATNDFLYVSATDVPDAEAQKFAYPEDFLWHKIGVSKAQGAGTSIYLDDQLIARGGDGGTPETKEDFITIGKDYRGYMDEIKVYRLSGGDAMSFNASQAYFYLGANSGNKTWTINISPRGTIDGIAAEGVNDQKYNFSMPIFINHPRLKVKAYVGNLGSGTNDLSNHTSGTLSGQSKIINASLTYKDMPTGFPQNGYVWVLHKNDDMQEVLEYKLGFNNKSEPVINIVNTNVFGRDGGDDANNGDLGKTHITLIYTEPVILYRNGDVL